MKEHAPFEGGSLSAELAARQGPVSVPLPASLSADAPDAERTDAKRGRWHTLNLFVDGVMSRLSNAERDVWLILFRDARPNGTSRTSVRDMARRAGIATRSVTRAVEGLKRRGLLRVVYQGGWGKGLSVYRVKAKIGDEVFEDN
jgi:hypothetical protein